MFNRRRTRTVVVGAAATLAAGAIGWTASTAAHAAPAPAAPPAGNELLSWHGDGSAKASSAFSTGDDWTINYTYDCANFAGGTGLFVIMGENSIPIVSDLANIGTGSVRQHARPGTHVLEVNAECKWDITVIGG